MLGVQNTAERRHFDHFLAQVPELAGATITEGESPDFVCSLPSRTVGVKLTEYHHAGRKIEVFEKKVVDAAQLIFEGQGGPHLYVSVGFYGWAITERLEVLARAIAATVGTHLPDAPVTEPAISVIVRDRELPAVLQPRVATILIMRFAWKDVRLWKRDVSGSRIEGDVAGIAAVITGKEVDIPSYKPCDQYWLLIYASADTLASTMVPAQTVTEHDYVTAFERVYVLDSVDGVQQLKTSTNP